MSKGFRFYHYYCSSIWFSGSGCSIIDNDNGSDELFL